MTQEAGSDTAKGEKGSGETAESEKAVSGSEETTGEEEQKDAGSSKDELITEKTELKFDGNGYKREWRSLYGGG